MPSDSGRSVPDSQIPTGIEVRWALQHPTLVFGWLEAGGVQWGPSDSVLDGLITTAVQRAQGEPWPPDATRTAIRDLLRCGGFKPTGRSKPASEYLAGVATTGGPEAFPRISNLVDINNLVSLRTGWPCSLIDLDLAGTHAFEVRFGLRDETYVFNRAGQSIDVTGLICLARAGGEPIANPVKDSMATKTHEGTSRVLFVTYASNRVASVAKVREVLAEVGGLLRRHGGAQELGAMSVVMESSERRS